MEQSRNKISEYFDFIPLLAERNVEILKAKGRDYGDSWCRRGGISAFMMLARKFDRLERACKLEPAPNDPLKEDRWESIFTVALKDTRQEDILDDIRDLQCYLLLVEAYIEFLKLQMTNIGSKSVEMEHPFGYDGED